MRAGAGTSVSSRLSENPLTSPGGLATASPMLHRCPSFIFCVGFLVDRASFLVSHRHFAGSDVEDELVPECDDNPGTPRGTTFSVSERILFPCSARCGF